MSQAAPRKGPIGEPTHVSCYLSVHSLPHDRYRCRRPPQPCVCGRSFAQAARRVQLPDRRRRAAPEAPARAVSDHPRGGSALALDAQAPGEAWALGARGGCRKIQLISKSHSKTDRRDARTLAQLGAGVPELLGEIRHRSEQAQADLTVLLTRDHFVQLMTATINRIRGVLKSTGVKVPRMCTKSFHAQVADLVPTTLRPGLLPLFEMLRALHQQIRWLDKAIHAMAARYPAVAKLAAVQGVGDLTALAFVLSLDDPRRFKKSRDVGPFVGLTPKKHASGEKDPQLSITRSGNPYLRRILVQAAHYILGPFGPDALLRRYGRRISERGGKHAKKRAAVAVARKLAVLLHLLWLSEVPYDPWYRSKVTAPPMEAVEATARPRRTKPRSATVGT